jgi:hypothetical protein
MAKTLSIYGIAILLCAMILFIALNSGHSTRSLPGSNMGDAADSVMQHDTTELSGRLFVGGHEPFTVLALEKEDGSAVVLSAGDSLYKELWSRQNQHVRIKGEYIPDPLHGQSFRVIEFKKEL